MRASETSFVHSARATYASSQIALPLFSGVILCNELPLLCCKRPFHPYLPDGVAWSGWINHSIGGEVNGTPTE